MTIRHRPISNLTGAEQDVLRILPTVPSEYRMTTRIARKLHTHDAWVCYILRQLVRKGYVHKPMRGIYEVIT